MKKTRRLFSKKKKKKELAVASDEPRNEYYENISVRFGIAQVVLYLSLFAFVVLSFFYNTELITYRNFYYFFKDLSATAEAVDIFSADSITYPTDDDQSFTLYRKGLAVAGNSSVTVFSATGRQIVSVGVSYRNPVAVGSGKYLLVYEAGGTQYSLYNSNVQVHSDKTEYPINGAAVSGSGKYALITSSRDATSAVHLYSDKFSKLAEYKYRDKYVMDVALNASGDRIAILYSEPANGTFKTYFLLADAGKELGNHEPSTVSLSMGLSCGFSSAGRVFVVCADRVLCFSDSGREEKRYMFEGSMPTNLSLSADGMVVSLKKSMISEESRVLVLDKNGNLIYDQSHSEKIGQIAMTGSSVYWTTPEGITRLNLKRGGELSHRSCATENRVLLAVSEEEALCCSPQKAVYIGFE